MELSMQYQSDTVESLLQENTALRQRCLVNEGRLTRMEKVVDDQHEETLQINARSMKDNIVFQNINERHDITGVENVTNTLVNFMQIEMQVQQSDVECVVINKAHRMGIKGRSPRAIVANINDEGKRIIWRHTKNLKDKNYSVFNQLPKELAERKKQLLPSYKAARDQNMKVKWAGEKLIINDTVTQVKKDKVKDINIDTTDMATSMRVKRSPPKTYDGSTFQGSRVNVATPDDVIPAIHAIYTDVRSARATHNIYAYRINSGQRIIEHYEDDGEYGAGRRLLGMLQKNDILNQLICVSRWHAGRNLGPVRFNYIEEAAKDTINDM